ncbi:MAG TPA: hypothetical protein VE821_02645, partial [Pyrinomonadaceae bacterium]|nr:hypothetical protein [Pyrinomonadaceae bacterium]
AGAMSATDWQVLLYTMGRAMLWVVVLSACLSMSEYFRGFYRAMTERSAAAREKAKATVTTETRAGQMVR